MGFKTVPNPYTPGKLQLLSEENYSTEDKTKLENIVNPMLFKGSITIASDFPTLAEVVAGWTYNIIANVTDNNIAKTNTGLSFLSGEDIAWNGTTWTRLGVSTIDWSNIDNRPSSSVIDIDDAVSKRHSNSLDHTQGTDQGLDTGGANEISALEIQNRLATFETEAGIYDEGIINGTDDGFVFMLDSAINLTDVILMGKNDGGSDNAGFRWLNINIPQGAIITSAHIVLTASEDTLNEITSININGEDSDNAITFSTFEDFIARPFCNASVPYIVPPFIGGETYNTPELKTIIQEIIDRPGWVTGNAIVIFLNDNGSGSFCVRNICSVDTTPTSSARLHIEYIYDRPLFTTPLKTKLDGIEASAVALATIKSDVDIDDSLDKKHDAAGQLNLSIANEISSLDEKTTLVDDDLILIEDSEATGAKKKVKKSNLSSGGGHTQNTDTMLDNGGSNPVRASEIVQAIYNIALLGFYRAIDETKTIYNLLNGFIDEYEDESGIDLINSENQIYNLDNYYSVISPIAGIDSYTKLMLHLDNNVIDSEISPKIVTDTGITFSDIIKKWEYSGYFNGSKCLLLNESPDFNFGSGNFTIDFNIYYLDEQDGTPAHGLISGITTANTGWYVGLYNADRRYIYIATSAESIILSDTPLEINTWQHVAIVRNGNILTMYLDGVSVGSTDVTGKIFNSDGNGISIGRAMTNNDTYYFKGYFDEIRISKGIARWTDDFSFPINPYTIEGLSFNMTLISKAQIADVEPTQIRIVLLQEDVDIITLNTDLKLWISLDDGANYIQVTLIDEGILSGDIHILVGVADVTTLTGTNILYKITTHNYKNSKIHGTAILWD